MTPLSQMIAACGLIALVLLSAAHLLRAIEPNYRKRPHLPLSERGCLSVLQLAAWLERIGAAWDAAIVRYRLERMRAVIEMESTCERVGRRAA